MKFDVLTLFPEMFKPLEESIIGRAKENKQIEIYLINIRDFSKDKHKHVDDTPYGGGAGMVMKPDVVYDGDYSLGKNIEVTSRILKVLFEKLAEKNVSLPGTILKVNMVLAGKKFPVQSTPEEVGKATADVLRECVPDELAGVVFLSGGQSVEQATENLQAVTNNGPFPWPVTFSFARALQDPALFAWKGDNENADEARKGFRERLVANCEALRKK